MIFVSDPMFHTRRGFPMHGLGKGPTPNRYMPHQGKRERARRLRLLTGAPAKETAG